MVIRRARRFVTAATLIVAIFLSVSEDARASAEDDPVLFMGILDQLEMRDTSGDNTFSWDVQGWFGQDLRKLWFKTEGERAGGSTNEAEFQFLYSKAIAVYWELQLGVRHDFEPSPSRSWAVIGVQGLAPYFFETDIALFVGDAGRTALRFESEYELLLTQRLILTPEIEVNFYGRDDAEVGVGSGLSDIETGIRLRYEIRRRFAPYIGVSWSKLFGNTADFAKTAGQDTSETQLVIGFRAWF